MSKETAEPPGSSDPENPPLSFEQAIDKLETMIDAIESGEVGLEEAIARYEQGQQLVKRCRTILDKAEQRIAELTPDSGSGLADTDVDE
ncbi:MAG: exodeoxyribonuclease VII small subunit [Phycisphaerales bacterium JB063]